MGMVIPLEHIVGVARTHELWQLSSFWRGLVLGRSIRFLKQLVIQNKLVECSMERSAFFLGSEV